MSTKVGYGNKGDVVAGDYFKRLHAQTPTRLWINHPWGDDLDKAIRAGAINCTTNPAYCSKLIQNEPDFIYPIIDSLVKEIDDDDEAAEAVVYQSVARVVERFRSLYEQSGGKCGFVTIQDDPRRDRDADAVIRAARRYRNLGPNFMIKVPVIQAGCAAMEELVAEDIPICATEVFSIAQAVYICELYERASAKCNKRPPFYVTHIAGIFDEHLANVVEREGIEISQQVLEQAGCYISRQEYNLLKERGYHGTLLGGGARSTRHFTELVGGDLHITINWSTAEQIIRANPPVVSRIGQTTPAEIIEELTEKLSDFRKAADPDGLRIEEFEDYGPVVLFRNAFLKGYGTLLDEIAKRRKKI